MTFGHSGGESGNIQFMCGRTIQSSAFCLICRFYALIQKALTYPAISLKTGSVKPTILPVVFDRSRRCVAPEETVFSVIYLTMSSAVGLSEGSCAQHLRIKDQRKSPISSPSKNRGCSGRPPLSTRRTICSSVMPKNGDCPVYSYTTLVYITGDYGSMAYLNTDASQGVDIAGVRCPRTGESKGFRLRELWCKPGSGPTS